MKEFSINIYHLLANYFLPPHKLKFASYYFTEPWYLLIHVYSYKLWRCERGKWEIRTQKNKDHKTLLLQGNRNYVNEMATFVMENDPIGHTLSVYSKVFWLSSRLHLVLFQAINSQPQVLLLCNVVGQYFGSISLQYLKIYKKQFITYLLPVSLWFPSFRFILAYRFAFFWIV